MVDDPFPHLSLADLDFSLAELSKLSSAQLALAPYCTKWDEALSEDITLEKRLIRTWRQRRERSRAKIGQPAGIFASPEERAREQWPLFELVSFAWELTGVDLETLTTAQLVTIVFHPDSTKDLVEQAGEVFWRRREREFTAGHSLPPFPIDAALDPAPAAPGPAPASAPPTAHVPVARPTVPPPATLVYAPPVPSPVRLRTDPAPLSAGSKAWLEDDVETRPRSAAAPLRNSSGSTSTNEPAGLGNRGQNELVRHTEDARLARVREQDAQDALRRTVDDERRSADKRAMLDAEREKARERDKREHREHSRPAETERERERRERRARVEEREREWSRERKRERSGGDVDLPDTRRRRSSIGSSRDDRHDERVREPTDTPTRDRAPHQASPPQPVASVYRATSSIHPPRVQSQPLQPRQASISMSRTGSAEDDELMPSKIRNKLKQLFVSNMPEDITIGQARNHFDDRPGLVGIIIGTPIAKYHNCAGWLLFENKQDREACMRKLGGTKFPGMKLALYVEYAEPGKVRHEVRWLDMSKDFRKENRIMSTPSQFALPTNGDGGPADSPFSLLSRVNTAPAILPPPLLPTSSSQLSPPSSTEHPKPASSPATSSSSATARGVSIHPSRLPNVPNQRPSIPTRPIAPIPTPKPPPPLAVPPVVPRPTDPLGRGLPPRPQAPSTSASTPTSTSNGSINGHNSNPHRVSDGSTLTKSLVRAALVDLIPPAPSPSTFALRTGSSNGAPPQKRPFEPDDSPPLIVTRLPPTGPRNVSLSLSIKGKGTAAVARSPPAATPGTREAALFGSSSSTSTPVTTSPSKAEDVEMKVKESPRLIDRLDALNGSGGGDDDVEGEGDGVGRNGLGPRMGKELDRIEIDQGNRFALSGAAMLSNHDNQFAPASVHSSLKLPPAPSTPTRPDIVLPLKSFYVSDHLYPLHRRPVACSLSLCIDERDYRQDCLVLKCREAHADARAEELVRFTPEQLTSVQYPQFFPNGQDALLTFWFRPSAPAGLTHRLAALTEPAPLNELGVDQVTLTVRVQPDGPEGRCSAALTARMGAFCKQLQQRWQSVASRLITGATGAAKVTDFDAMLEKHYGKYPRERPTTQLKADVQDKMVE